MAGGGGGLRVLKDGDIVESGRGAVVSKEYGVLAPGARVALAETSLVLFTTVSTWTNASLEGAVVP